MVTFIPPCCGEEIKSNAEKKMFDILQHLTLKNAYVLHSLGLPKHRSKIYGEIDFVVVCDRGVACLEIKGGRVECRDGKWYFTDRYGKEHEKTEGPFAQVIGNMFSLRNVLREKFQTNPHMKKLLMACGVVFPDIAFTSASQEMIPEIICDIRTTDITEYISGIFDYWQSRQHGEPARLSPADIQAVVGYLRGNFTYIPSLGDRLEDAERRLVRLTSEQVRLMDALAVNPRLLVQGGAGTGKTLLAADFARKQADLGKKVLFLTYNRNLANCVASQLETESVLEIINIHALFGIYIPVSGDEIKTDPKKYFNETLPDLFWEYLRDLVGEELEKLQYDLLILDEGQDLLRPSYLYPLDYLLKGGLNGGNWAVFYDEKQNIYNPEYQEGMELMQSCSHTKFSLFVNCRNTFQIGDYTFQQCGIKTGECLRENGEEVETIVYSTRDDFKKKIKEVYHRLRREKIPAEDITFLSANKYKNSILADVNITVNEIGEEAAAKPDFPSYSTIQGFKGLDSKVVILFGAEHFRKEFFQEYMYIAGTRARTLLIVFRAGENL